MACYRQKWTVWPGKLIPLIWTKEQQFFLMKPSLMSGKFSELYFLSTGQLVFKLGGRGSHCLMKLFHKKDFFIDGFPYSNFIP